MLHCHLQDELDFENRAIKFCQNGYEILDTENIYKRIKSYTPEHKEIYYWWYDPYVYNLNSVYIPTFYSYITPYIEISLPYVIY